MSVLFDTSILIDCVNGIAAAEAEIKRHREGMISVVTWIEVMSGVRTASESDRMRRFLLHFACLDLDAVVAEETAVLRQRHRLKLADASILATAVVHRVTLLTRDTGFPKRLANIRVPYVL